MANSTWKAVEREICKRLGLERHGPTGVPAPDGTSDWLIAEVKHRKRLPRLIVDGMAQVEQHATGQQTAVLVLHEKGQEYDDCLVVLRLREWQELHGD